MDRRHWEHPSKGNPAFTKPLHLAGISGKGFILVGMAGVLILSLIAFTNWTGNGSNQTIHFTPTDVVYGEKIHAVHDMGTISYPRYSSPNSS